MNPDNPIWKQFNAVYRVLLILEGDGGTFTLNHSVGKFEFQVMATEQRVHLRVQRGYDSVGASIPRTEAITGNWTFDAELDLFIMYALKWHTANPVHDRGELSKQYDQDARYLRS